MRHVAPDQGMAMSFLWNVLKRKVVDPEGTSPGSEPPWKARSVVAAGATSAAGLCAWIGGYSPALLRFGGSYLGGFLAGWIFRRFVKTSALVAGGIILLVAGLKSTGWITLDVAGIGTWFTESLASLQAGAEGIKQILMGYLPSAGAGAAGMFFGFRKK